MRRGRSGGGHRCALVLDALQAHGCDRLAGIVPCMALPPVSGWGSAQGGGGVVQHPPSSVLTRWRGTALYVVTTIHTVASGAFRPPLPKRCRAGGRPGKPVQRCEIRPSCWPSSSPAPKPRNPYAHLAANRTGPRLAGGGGASPSLVLTKNETVKRARTKAGGGSRRSVDRSQLSPRVDRPKFSDSRPAQ